jgi:hypothetical protein
MLYQVADQIANFGGFGLDLAEFRSYNPQIIGFFVLGENASNWTNRHP